MLLLLVIRCMLGPSNDEVFEKLNTILTGGEDGNVMNTLDATATIQETRVHRYCYQLFTALRFVRLNMACFICHELDVQVNKNTEGQGDRGEFTSSLIVLGYEFKSGSVVEKI